MPRAGEIVTLQIAEGVVVRNPRSGRKHATGDRVTWSPFYARRAREGALTVKQAPPPPDVPERETEGVET